MVFIKFSPLTNFKFYLCGLVKATLIGSKGSTLKCLMQYADSTRLTLFGGVGECVHSGGSVIDVV